MTVGNSETQQQRAVRETPPEPIVVEKPWGRFIQYVQNEPVTVKILEVKKGEVLSLQSHRHRSELWIPLDEGAVIEKDGVLIKAKAMEPVFIPQGCRHRLKGEDNDCRVLEISFGIFDEDDIVRYEDRYGRPTEGVK
ncbi:MAG: phosphomannose isomerase type II C-terminal cupin domain [Armatimonadetes bacterium]|nr:phosphomannose isomerase type II C-terminal cupin domain [Armatimonadota bacterium]MDW8122551.1 phosphomannose isomerase type II C-terminal cupin domain [Armatimonadota bacterium]